MLEADHLGGWAEGLEAGAFLLQLLVGVADCLDGKTDAALDLVDLDDAGFDRICDLDDVLDLFHVILAELRDVDEAVDVTVEGDKRTEGCDFRNRAFDQIADLEAVVDSGPWVVLGLFDTEGDTLVALVDCNAP